ERIDEIERRVRGSHFIVDVDQQHVARVAGPRINPRHVDPRFEAQQRFANISNDAAEGRRADGREYEIVNAASEVRAHDTLTLRRTEYHENRLSHALFVLGARQLSACVERQRELSANAEK